MTGDDGPVITQEEWLAYVTSDPEMSLDDGHPDPGTSFLYTARSVPWQLWWDAGEIYTRYPPPDVIAKLVRIAKALDAQVVDDDGDLHEA